MRENDSNNTTAQQHIKIPHHRQGHRTADQPPPPAALGRHNHHCSRQRLDQPRWTNTHRKEKGKEVENDHAQSSVRSKLLSKYAWGQQKVQPTVPLSSSDPWLCSLPYLSSQISHSLITNTLRLITAIDALLWGCFFPVVLHKKLLKYHFWKFKNPNATGQNEVVF